MDRRHFVGGLLYAGGGLAFGRAAAAVAPTTIVPAKAGRKKKISGFHNGFRVPPGKIYEIKGTVTSDANVLVEGTLRMRPGATLRFIDVDESAFVGEGFEPIDSDVGLWVVGDGQLDIQGTPKVAWNRTGDDPSWSRKDELVVSPTDRGDYGEVGFAGFRRGSPVPEATSGLPAEVLNLTRDVVIEGTRGGKSHIFIFSTRPQTISHCLIHHMGPRKPDGDVVVGRWGLHFHHSGKGSRGSLVEGVVARNFGAHAFVPHASHGITMRECIAYDCWQSPFWWDVGDQTNNLLFERCVAAFARQNPAHNYEKYNLSGFVLGRGRNVTLRDCVAVGVTSGKNGGGFHWRDVGKQSPWTLKGTNVAHNNKTNGALTWHNSGGIAHAAIGFACYRNALSGINHGAYGTPFWHYSGLRLCENVGPALKVHSLAGTGRPADRSDGYRFSFENLVVEGHNVLLELTRHGCVTTPDDPEWWCEQDGALWYVYDELVTGGNADVRHLLN